MTLHQHLRSTSKVQRLKKLIRSRLLGADLGQPYSMQAGECPEDALMDYVERCKSEGRDGATRLFDRAMSDLVREETLKLGAALASSDNFDNAERTRESLNSVFTEERLLFCSRLSRVAQVTGCPTQWRVLFNWVATFFDLVSAHPGAAALFGYIMPCLGPALREQHASIHTFCFDAIDSESAVAPILRTLAVWDCKFLEQHLLPHYFSRLAQRLITGSVQVIDLGAHRDSLWGMLAAVDDLNSRIRLGSRIRGLALHNCKEARSSALHHLVFDVLVSADLNHEAFAFDNAFWNQVPIPDIGMDKGVSDDWRRWLKRLERDYEARLTRRKDTLKIGIPRFAEAALVILFARVIEAALKMKVEVKGTGWSQVPSGLRDRSLDLAIHNRLNVGNDLKRSNFLFSFVGYEVLIRRDWARKILLERQKAGKSSPLLTKALSGEGSVLHQKLRGDEGQELGELFRLGSLGMPDQTDIAVRIQQFCAENGVPMTFHNVEEDEGVERFVNGELDLYAGGANHAFYMRRHFPALCGRLISLPHIHGLGSPNTLVCRANFQEEFGFSLEVLTDLWYETAKLWKQEMESVGEQRPGILGQEPLANYLVLQINSHSRANFWSFGELVDVLKEHTILYYEAKEVPGWASSDDQTLEDAARQIQQRIPDGRVN